MARFSLITSPSPFASFTPAAFSGLPNLEKDKVRMVTHPDFPAFIPAGMRSPPLQLISVCELDIQEYRMHIARHQIGYYETSALR